MQQCFFYFFIIIINQWWLQQTPTVSVVNCWYIFTNGFNIRWCRYIHLLWHPRRMTVSSLICSDSQTWDFQKLQDLFGFQQALNIATSVTVPFSSQGAPDSLFFIYAKNGNFTTKKAYQLIKGDQMAGTHKAFWEMLWKGASIIPKLRMFLWRGINKVLPVRGVIGSRIQSVPLYNLININAPDFPFIGIFKGFSSIFEVSVSRKKKDCTAVMLAYKLPLTNWWTKNSSRLLEFLNFFFRMLYVGNKISM